MDDKDYKIIYECKKCHSKFIIKEYRKDIYCPYCLSDEFDIKQNDNEIDIKYILPFEKNRDDAIRILLHNYKNKHFLPEIYRNKGIINRIIGLYIPVGLYDVDINFSINLKGKVKKNGVSKEYNIERIGEATYNNIPINSNILKNSLKIFDYSFKDIKNYDSSYLTGYMTNIVNLKYNDPENIVDENIIADTLNKIKKDIKNYDDIDITSKKINISKVDLKKCFIPIWILTVNVNNKVYSVLINGQNGKTFIDYPCDKIKIIILFIILFILCLLLSLILYIVGVI